MSEHTEWVTITYQDFKELKRLHKRAVETKQTSFMFLEREILVDYAKYLIQYLETKFNRKGK